MGYELGHEVLRCEPFSYVVYTEFRSTVCDFCLKAKTSHSLKKCSACKIVYYCDSTCQKNAWKSHHQDECQYLKTIPNELLSNQVWQILRIILKLQRENTQNWVVMPNGEKRYFDDLMDHYDDILLDTKRLDAFHSVYVILSHSLESKIPDKHEVLKIYGKIIINAFDIVNDGLTEGIAQGLYLESSVFDHSCSPNAVWSYRGKEMYIRTVAKVEKFSDLRISYLLKLFDTTEKRRRNLQRHYYFFCQCSRCQDVESDRCKSSLKCKKCQGCVPSVIGVCTSCQFQTTSSALKEHRHLKAQISQLVSQPSDIISDYESLYKRAAKIFHHYDIDFLELLNLYGAKQICTGNVPKSLDTLKSSLPLMLASYYQNFPPYDLNIGGKEIEVANLFNILGMLDEAEDHINKAKEILEVHLGQGHPLIIGKWNRVRQEINMNKHMQIHGKTKNNANLLRKSSRT